MRPLTCGVVSLVDTLCHFFFKDKSHNPKLKFVSRYLKQWWYFVNYSVFSFLLVAQASHSEAVGSVLSVFFLFCFFVDVHSGASERFLPQIWVLQNESEERLSGLLFLTASINNLSSCSSKLLSDAAPPIYLSLALKLVPTT